MKDVKIMSSVFSKRLSKLKGWQWFIIIWFVSLFTFYGFAKIVKLSLLLLP